MNKPLLVLLAGSITLSACHSSTPKNYNKEDSTGTKAGATSADSSAGGFVALFDGKTTKGWHAYGKSAPGAAWKVDDGTLHLDASQKGDWQSKNGGDMVSDEEYTNFDLKLEWKISKAGNSGILFLVKEDTTKYKYSYFTGPECQVVDNKENEDGKLIKHRAGDLYDLISISKEVAKPAGEWNQVEIVCNNSKLDFTINGEHVLSTTLWDDNWKKLVAGSKFKEWPDFGTFKTGHIVLQDHGADVWYRNVELKKL
jgi:hypothetical protein